MKLPGDSPVLPVRHSHTADQDLLRRAQAGDLQAFDELVRRLTPRLFRIVRRMASDSDQAEGWVQETWLRAWRKSGQWRGTGDPIAWLAAIAVHLARDDWRKQSPMDFADLGDEGEGLREEAPGPEQVVDRAELLGRLARAVQQLRPAQRAVIALRYDAGLSYEDVARAMAIPVNTVRTHLHRAKAALRAWLESEDDRSVG